MNSARIDNILGEIGLGIEIGYIYIYTSPNTSSYLLISIYIYISHQYIHQVLFNTCNTCPITFTARYKSYIVYLAGKKDAA